MLREIINAVYVTYVASEWWLADADRAVAPVPALRCGKAWKDAGIARR